MIDRVLLSACGQRAALDREAGQEDAKVFHTLDLDADAPEPTDGRVTDMVEDLYRRLLSRDPQPFEVTQVAELVVDADGDPVAAADFATLACYAIGTTTEFLFF